jgi:predicted ATPase
VHFVERGGQDELPDGTRSEFYVFVHGLYREMLYRRQAATRRAEWHKRIALRLESIFRGREWAVARDVAMHLEAAGEWTAAAEALRQAARHANENGARDEAASLDEGVHSLAETRENMPAGIAAVAAEDGTSEAVRGTNGQRRRLQAVSGKA